MKARVLISMIKIAVMNESQVIQDKLIEITKGFLKDGIDCDDRLDISICLLVSMLMHFRDEHPGEWADLKEFIGDVVNNIDDHLNTIEAQGAEVGTYGAH